MLLANIPVSAGPVTYILILTLLVYDQQNRMKSVLTNGGLNFRWRFHDRDLDFSLL